VAILGASNPLSATTVRLLRAAAEVAGGPQALAARLNISEKLLGMFIADRSELPDVLLLRAVDIILEDRQSRPATLGRPAAQRPVADTGHD
jgi:hypothetical protein